jgi:hypothetical protein
VIILSEWIDRSWEIKILRKFETIEDMSSDLHHREKNLKAER